MQRKNVCSMFLRKYYFLFLGWTAGMILACPMDLIAQAWLDVVCSHDSSRIIMDGVFLGQTPLNDVPIDTGCHHLHVTPRVASSWSIRDWERRFYAMPGDTIRFSVVLQESEMTAISHVFDMNRASDSATSEIQFMMNQSLVVKKSVYHENWFRFGVMSLLTGIAGYYLKDCADDAYLQYLHADTLEKMNHFFDRSVMYDKLSGACYINCEVSLGVSLYLGIRDMR